MVYKTRGLANPSSFNLKLVALSIIYCFIKLSNLLQGVVRIGREEQEEEPEAGQVRGVGRGRRGRGFGGRRQ